MADEGTGRRTVAETLLERLRALRGARGPEGLLVRCAWCGRIEVDGVFVVPDAELSQHVEDRATHGICPDCLTRVNAAAAEQRGHTA